MAKKQDIDKIRRDRVRDIARKLNRPGYWGCEECGAHNPDYRVSCIVCGKFRAIQ